ncbi:MAG: hypothetical protein ACI3YD_07280 [Alloprevotella sp.]
MRFLCFLLLFLHASLFYAKEKKVRCEGTYTYTYSGSLSHDEAKVRAVDYAITMALADQFGTTVTSQSFLDMTGNWERFEQRSRTLVKGKLVRHIHEPVISNPLYENNQFTLEVKVSFYALPLDYPPTEFSVHVLRNGTEDRFESDQFRSDDKFYLSFTSPKAGYLAVFFEDRQNVLCMLPYIGEEQEPFRVEQGKRYLLFDQLDNTYHMTCGEESEKNLVHVLFSPQPFIDGDLEREMTCRRFSEWLDVRRSYDSQMQVESILIRVEPQTIY